ncbi:Uncharacterised protein [Chryseobacterium taihuense]|uniref:Uncharacterized protein n=1 Tax=Chryseobacterium taihuense TaxID=1141221 RepID=A0A4U8W7L7_9FLAO|nr:Uncharacterised protein [Chryseobacterium taihuense]
MDIIELCFFIKTNKDIKKKKVEETNSHCYEVNDEKIMFFQRYVIMKILKI